SFTQGCQTHNLFSFQPISAQSPDTQSIDVIDKLSLFSFTTGGSKEKYAIRGDIRYLLWPMQHGIMHFCGVKVLEPHICYAPENVSEEKRKEMLTAWTQRLKTLWKEEPIDCSPQWYFK
uniref:Ribosyldihydronicotinamide dehydrogenase [quinone]-like n=1 Tax=Cyanistes caeruleus TaxID=156563 RepID=A0A8C0U6I9_CYACU